ncbi:hypothetical protein LIER_25730 [Lithospermum erythrorhizon]|uniref:Uncharacterized protein n=1 Tax=Lithospermum erythrorhizon TaxID=34254 RepID=A0AAV3R980_LITER
MEWSNTSNISGSFALRPPQPQPKEPNQTKNIGDKSPRVRHQDAAQKRFDESRGKVPENNTSQEYQEKETHHNVQQKIVISFNIYYFRIFVRNKGILLDLALICFGQHMIPYGTNVLSYL